MRVVLFISKDLVSEEIWVWTVLLFWHVVSWLLVNNSLIKISSVLFSYLKQWGKENSLWMDIVVKRWRTNGMQITTTKTKTDWLIFNGTFLSFTRHTHLCFMVYIIDRTWKTRQTHSALSLAQKPIG